MQSVIRIGSRESRLAVRQAEIVKEELIRCNPQLSVEIVTMKTTGDKILDKSLALIGGKGLFVKELDLALKEGRIDLAVHSLKDMPMEENEEFPILAYGKREDPRDVMIFGPSGTLPSDPVIGTSSRRREIQLQKYYPKAQFRGIRGNVQTRLRKLQEEGYDGTILAAAGLKRLGMEHIIGKYFSVEELIPAAGQGILAIQGSRDLDKKLISCLDHRESRIAAESERAFIRMLDGGCTSPCAAHAQVSGDLVKMWGLYYQEEQEKSIVETICFHTSEAKQCAAQFAEKLKRENG